MRIRPATPEDAPQIARVYMDSARHHTALDGERYALPREADVIHRYADGRQLPQVLSPDQRVTFVAERGGAIVGFLDAHLDAQADTDTMQSQWSFVYVAELAVAEEARGAGVGAALLAAAEEWGQAHGAQYVFLQVLAANADAVRFYERMHYAPCSHNMMKRLPSS